MVGEKRDKERGEERERGEREGVGGREGESEGRETLARISFGKVLGLTLSKRKAAALL